MELIDIGNSRGIRLPKTIINKYGFSKGVRVVEEKKCIKIFPLEKHLRQGWQDFYTKNAKTIDVDLEFLECGIDNGIN